MKTTVHTPLDLFFDQLRDIYSMEVQLSESMPHMVSMCTNEELRALILGQAYQNCNQLAEISTIFERQGEAPGDDRCRAMEGLIKGGTVHLEGVESPPTRDLMMVAHCLRIEHYQMAAYEITMLLSAGLGLMRETVTLSEILADQKEMAAVLMELEPHLFTFANSGRRRKAMEIQYGGARWSYRNGNDATLELRQTM